MTTQNITRWLQEPNNLPDKAIIDAALKAWPWFVPVRLMEAAHSNSDRSFNQKTLSLLDLYGPDIVTAHQLLALPLIDHIAPAAAIDEDIESVSLPQSGINPEEVIHHPVTDLERESLIEPFFTEDYFRHQGIAPETSGPESPVPEPAQPEDPKTLMVMMSFADWLAHFKVKSQREQDEDREKRALRSMWQQEKLAAALEEETEEIPEDVFEMAVNSITREDDIASEPLAQILEKQEKWSAAAEMYRKLGLRNPAKSSYFASRAEAAKKRLQ